MTAVITLHAAAGTSLPEQGEAPPLVLYAGQAYEAGRFGRARDLLVSQLRRTPNDPELHARLAFAYWALGQRQRAAIAAAESSALAADAPAWWRAHLATSLGRTALGEAAVAALELARLAPGDCSAARVTAASLLAALALEAAEALLVTALEACPDEPDLLALLGRLLLDRGCAGEALAALERAQALATDKTPLPIEPARRAVQSRYLAADRELQALEREVIGAVDGDTEAHRSASARFRLLLPAFARHDQAGEGDPEHTLRLAELYRLGAEIGFDGARERALEQASLALVLRPSWARALVLQGTLALTGDPPRPLLAERAFREALGAADALTLPAVWSGLFFVYLEQDRDQEAAEAAERYLALAPDDQEFKALLGELSGESRPAGKARR